MYVETMANVSNILLDPSLPTMPNFGIRYPFIYCVVIAVVIFGIMCILFVNCFMLAVNINVTCVIAESSLTKYKCVFHIPDS